MTTPRSPGVWLLLLAGLADGGALYAQPCPGGGDCGDLLLFATFVDDASPYVPACAGVPCLGTECVGVEGILPDLNWTFRDEAEPSPVAAIVGGYGLDSVSTTAARDTVEIRTRNVRTACSPAPGDCADDLLDRERGRIGAWFVFGAGGGSSTCPAGMPFFAADLDEADLWVLWGALGLPGPTGGPHAVEFHYRGLEPGLFKCETGPVIVENVPVFVELAYDSTVGAGLDTLRIFVDGVEEATCQGTLSDLRSLKRLRFGHAVSHTFSPDSRCRILVDQLMISDDPDRDLHALRNFATCPRTAAPTFGACCAGGFGPQSTCVETSQQDCLAGDGFFFGDATACTPDLQCLPLAVTLDALSAEQTSGGVVVRWTTATEVDTAGFRVLRQPAGARAKSPPEVVSGFIPAGGTALAGASYRFLDDSAEARSSVHYFLQDVDVYGRATLHGPIAVERRGRFRSARRSPADSR